MKAIEARENTLMRLFQRPIRYDIPADLQRPYVWRKDEQWEPLWRDVRYAAERWLKGNDRYEHFLGATVLQFQRTSPGGVEQWAIIDGHQRFTTLQLLLASARDTINVVLPDDDERRAIITRITTLTENGSAWIDSDADLRYKVWPLEADRAQFQAAMATVHPTGDGAARHEMVKARNHFNEQISDWLGALGSDVVKRAQALDYALREMMTVVTIDVGADVDPNTIFETLNARGTQLLEWDITKSKVMRATREASPDLRESVAKTIQSVEEDGDWWRAELGQGRYRHARIDEFLNHFLVVRIKKEVPRRTESQVFEANLLRDPSSFPELFSELRTLRDTYRELLEFEDNSPYGLFLHRWRTMQMGVMTPALLWLRSKLAGTDEFDRVIRAFESYMVRRMVSGLTTRGYHDLLLDLMAWLPDADRASVVNDVVNALTARDEDRFVWPSDKRFRDDIETMPTYKRLTRARTRMLLEALEQHLRSTDEMTETDAVPDKLTIEHVMPQEWHEHWQPLKVGAGDPDDVADESPIDRRNRLIHTLGNLTLVNRKLNPSMSNASWGEKRAALKTHSTLLLNNALDSTPAWDEDAIIDRSRQLADLAIQIWPAPKDI